MKKTFGYLLIISSLFLNSCGKNVSGCQPTPVANEKDQLVAYCNANGITYSVHPSGILYEIIAPGSGVPPTVTSTVSVIYTGKHLDNTTFDANSTPYTTLLNDFIDGWKIGLTLIKKGGRIKLLVPSALGYSCTGSGLNASGQQAIKANEPLFFDVTLTDVK
jgi:FKBP-type peptidyl-prolyl cis-trans isomerase FkpA